MPEEREDSEDEDWGKREWKTVEWGIEETKMKHKRGNCG
jgi:hypothetical protein